MRRLEEEEDLRAARRRLLTYLAIAKIGKSVPLIYIMGMEVA